MTTKRERAAEEDLGWRNFEDLLQTLSPAQMQEPGYTPEGWSVKDLMAHVGCWMAEAGRELQRMRVGTYDDRPLDVDAMNREFYEANKDLPLPMIRAELFSSRIRMLQEWNALAEVIPDAEDWFVESGPNHYREHFPRLQAWAEELRAGG